MSIVKDWPVLNRIEIELLSQIEFIYIFGKTGDEVIITTKDDTVYAFGSNVSGCLGLGHSRPVAEPARVDALCNKRITLFVSNNYSVDDSGARVCYYVLALTKSGALYSWGANKYGTLGNGSVLTNYTPSPVQRLVDVQIVDVCCGYYHCLALSRAGEVYAWGYNQYGSVGNGRNTTPQVTPIKVTALEGETVTAIACGLFHSLALTDAGVVFGWGYNSEGELGIGHRVNQNSPIRVLIDKSVVITQIRCGYAHTLLLSADGHVYAFGHNGYGQIGDGSTNNKLTPNKLVIDARVVDILALPLYNISMALSADERCFVWGVDYYVTPTEVRHKNLNDAFNAHMHMKATLRPLSIAKTLFTPVVLERHSKSFDNRHYSDLRFAVNGKHIYAQKLYLKGCCRHFDRLFSDDPTLSEIEVTQHSYAVYYAFLNYLYTSAVRVDANEDALDLYELANSYGELELRDECVKIIKNMLDVDNVCQLFEFALKFGSKELEDYCFGFAYDRMPDIRRTQGFRQMDSEALKTLFSRYFDHYKELSSDLSSSGSASGDEKPESKTPKVSFNV